MSKIKKYEFNQWSPALDDSIVSDCVDELEKGNLLFFPQLAFFLSGKETTLFSPHILSENHKNVSYDRKKDLLQGCQGPDSEIATVHQMMRRFSEESEAFVKAILPHYQKTLQIGRTSFRPAEIAGRKAASYKKDDTRIHVDAFPSTPTQGKRILRFFSNVNLENKPRVWKVGEPYEEVLRKFASKVHKPFPMKHLLLEKIGITKTRRSMYDHYMLKIHDMMKKDMNYQQQVDHEMIQFPSKTSWLCFTDQVSHAAISGQYVFEQSFYLEPAEQKFPQRAPIAMISSYT